MANVLRPLTVLGLETSCDETAAAVVRGIAPGPGEILSNVVFSQLEEHRPYGGVVPEIAARAHVEALDAVIEQALRDAKCSLADLDAIAATAGPGLIGGVMVGLTTGKALALATGKPLIAVNHLEAHAFTARLTEGASFPFLLLLISGGHCQLLAVEGVGRFRLYGTTIDDAIGEAFDKTAKLLGLPYPGGPAIERLAAQGDAKRFALPRPMLGREGCDFSLSGLKTAVRQIADMPGFGGRDKADLAAAFQSAVVDVLVDRTRGAMLQFADEFGKYPLTLPSPPTGEGECGSGQMTSAQTRVRGIAQPETAGSAADPTTLVVAGGVAANGAIRSALERLCIEQGFALKIPPPKLCTDNAAMVAWAGVERGQIGLFDGLDFAPKARWPLPGVPARGSLAADTPGKYGP